MNLFEFIAFVAIIFGLVYGAWLAMNAGVWAAILGGLKGAAIAFGWYVLLMFLILTTLSLGLHYRPEFPRCRNGRCRDLDYTYLYLDQKPTAQHQWLQDSREGKLVRCRCGMIYLNSLRDRSFYEVLDDGTLVPFMCYRPLGRWRLDNSAHSRKTAD